MDRIKVLDRFWISCYDDIRRKENNNCQEITSDKGYSRKPDGEKEL